MKENLESTNKRGRRIHKSPQRKKKKGKLVYVSHTKLQEIGFKKNYRHFL